MTCKSCGAQNLGNIFGTCLRCTLIAGFSSMVFWSIYYAASQRATADYVLWPLLGFAAFVTLLFVGHLLGHLQQIRTNKSKKLPGKE
jgi:hypothetical protein